MIKDNPLADHARAFEDASEGGEYSNLAACYLDLTAKHNRLIEQMERIQKASHCNMSTYGIWVKEIADQALRDFLKEG